MQKNWFTVFNVKVTARAYIIKLWHSSNLLVRLQPNMVWQYSTMSRSIMWTNLVSAFKVKVAAKVQNGSKCLSGWYLLNHRTFCRQTWYVEGSWWSKYESFYYIFWTAYSSAAKLGLMIQHCKPECLLVKKMDYCIQAEGHSEGSKCQRLSRWFLQNRPTFCCQTWC